MPNSENQLDPSLIGPYDTIAGNPAKMSVSLVRVIRCNPLILLGTFLATGIGIGIAAGARFPWWAGSILGVVYFVSEIYSNYFRVKEKFHRGDLCPGLVVTEKPYLVAVYTDLSTGRAGPKPVIKIIDPSLTNMTGGPPRVGDRVITVAYYGGSVQADQWDDFDPTVANCVCNDPAQIARAMASIEPEHWQFLQENIRSLPQSPGLYPLWQKAS